MTFCKEVRIVILLLLLSCNKLESNSQLTSFTVKYLRSINRIELNQLQKQKRIGKPEEVEIQYDRNEIRVNFNLVRSGGGVIGDLSISSDTMKLLYQTIEPRTRDYNQYNLKYVIDNQDEKDYIIIIREIVAD